MNRKDKAWTIVLIDDEPGIRKVTTVVLEDWGYTVHTAENGEAGIRLCKKTAPQVVITDVKMPGMDGLAVLARLKQDCPDMEVIVMTAFGDIETAIKAIQLNASDFITKPVNDQALELAIDRAKERYTARLQVQEYTHMLETGWSRATLELKKNFAFQDRIIRHSINGIIATGPNGEVRIFNNSVQAMTGYDPDHSDRVLTLDHLFGKAENKRINEALDSRDHGGKNRIDLLESRIVDCRGESLPVQISASVLFDDTEKAGLLICLRDLRELRRIERKMADQEKILHQDKMMSLGRLAASVVHEINNPLSGILNYLRLMNRITGKTDPEKGLTPDRLGKFSQYLDICITETARCSSIISNLLTFSRKSAIAYEAVGVKTLLERTALLTGHKLAMANVSLKTACTPSVPDIRADANQVQQCLINLVFNALDATDDGGQITLSAETKGKTGGVCIRVQDTGSGIPEKDLPHIFDPFFTTKEEGHGVGLGLSTVYGIMERHGGHVAVEKTGPSGTCFVLEFNALA